MYGMLDEVFYVVGDAQEDVPFTRKLIDALPRQLVLVGDYLDSFDYPWEEHVHLLNTVLTAVERGELVALIGNHEMSYLHPRMRCSGFSFQTDVHITPIKEKMKTFLDPLLWIEDMQVLITHAGVTQEIWNPTLSHNTNIAMIEEDYYLGPDRAEFFFQIGYRRGGSGTYGGPLWNDFRDFKPVQGITQIFGHTRQQQAMKTSNGDICIDTLSSSKEGVRINTVTHEISCVDLTTLV